MKQIAGHYYWFLLLFVACQQTPQRPISYNQDIRPIFNEKCMSCHGGVKQSGDFGLVFKENAFGKTESGKPAIIPGNHQESELYKRLIHEDTDLRMPQDAPSLTAKEIELIAQWIDEGAEWETHWSFIPPAKNMVVPNVQQRGWIRNDLDKFVLHKLIEKGLKTNKKATESTLIRRIYLDLIGLSPSLEEAQAFYENTDKNKLENLVNTLLQSPHFGEHWATLWLDLARYGDSQGYQKDLIRKHIWRYRDWVIHAFNQDMPFDQFTIEQLAGDLLPNPTDEQILATAFHRNTNTNTEGGTDDEEFRTYAVMDRLNTTFEIWQGLTMSCVQCHSHPYDPIIHEEFYEGLAYFNNTADADKTNEYPRKKLLSPGQKIQLEKLEHKIQQYKNDTLSPAYVQLVSQMTSIEPAGVPIMEELQADKQRTTQLFERGNWLMKGKTVQPNIPKALGRHQLETTGNRLALAKWLVHPENPLTARVIVNRIWANIFGEGLVSTLEDFGTQGAKPIHQDLLDWLAMRFVHEHKWRIKPLLKDIILSATYQQSSKIDSKNQAIDPTNQYLSRMNRFRLSAEQIRDQALMAGDLLNKKIFGPSVMPYMPKGGYSVIRNAHTWNKSGGKEAYRRGLYTFWRKTSPYPSMITFDSPSREFCVSRRVRTNTPLQAMVILNDPVYLEAAMGLAKKMKALATKSVQVQLGYGFEVLFLKKPTIRQLTLLNTFYEKAKEKYKAAPIEAQTLLENFSDNNERDIELATLLNVANVMMNMDEFIMKN